MERLSVETSLGRFTLAAQGEWIVGLSLPGSPPPSCPQGETEVLRQARRELLEYLAGERTRFTLPMRPQGTDFQRQVWGALMEIPYGQTRSYGALAAALGRPGAARAVGQANRRNPIPLLIPCHRVVGSDGSLTGYAGGLNVKKRLLDLEQGKERKVC